MLYFMQREVYCKENLVDTDRADSTNVYPVFIFPGNIKTFQFLVVVFANDLRCCIIGLLFLVAEVLKNHTDLIFKFKPKIICLRR
jgi:hypothetical protein